MAKFFAVFTKGEDNLGVPMKKLAIVLAAAAALTLTAAPLTSAVAADKKLWEGWMEDVKKLQSDIAAKLTKK
jgi:hypothetical protein